MTDHFATRIRQERRIPRSFPRWLQALAAATAIALLAGAPARAEDVVKDSNAGSASSAVPYFWDPNFRPDKPPGEPGSIRFMTAGDFPPFDFLDSGGRLIGFNVDLARAVCDILGATCTIQMRPFDDLANALVEKRGDAVIAGLKVGPDLAPKIDVSGIYLTTPGRFVTRKGGPTNTTPEGLKKRWISVVSGSAHEAFILDFFKDSRVVSYPTDRAARDALRDGTVDVNFGDAITSSFWLLGDASHQCCTFAGDPYLESAYFGDGFSIAFQRGNKRLKQQLDFALHRLGENGTMRELYFRYFPLGYY